MVSSTLKPQKRDKRAWAPGSASVVSDFQVLGLRDREARLEVIRRALSRAARQHRVGGDVFDEELARVVVSGYRLLDPRRRCHLLERVQLLLWTEEDLTGVQGSWWSSTSEVEDAATAKPETQENAPVNSGGATRPESVVGQSIIDPARLGVSNSHPTTLTRTEEAQAAFEMVQLLRQHQRRANGIWLALLLAVMGLGMGLAAATGWF